MYRRSVLLSFTVVLALAAGLTASPTFLSDPHNNDFTAYWAAGWLNLHGQDPYGAANLLAVEQTLGWVPSKPLMLWNPPWILGPLMLAGAVDFTLARNLWLVLQLTLMLLCGIALWRYYRGPAPFEIWIIPLVLLFAPVWLSMKYGQIGPLCLLGLVGFLCCARSHRDVLAGAMLSLAAIKPHLVYLIWPAVLVWAMGTRRWGILLGLMGGGLLLAVAPLMTNSGVYGDFLRMTREPPPPELGGLFITNQDSPTFGWLLRTWFAPDLFKLQYVPSLLGLMWLAWYSWRSRHIWQWSREMPLLLLVSLCTAAYGAWPADSLLLLPAIVAVAAELARQPQRTRVVLAIGVLVSLTLATFVVERQPTTEVYVWVRLGYLAAFLGLRNHTC